MQRAAVVLLATVLGACHPYVVPAPPVAGQPAVVVSAREARFWLPAPTDRARWRWGGPPAQAGDVRARYAWQVMVQPSTGLLLWAADSRRDRPDSVPLATVLRETHLNLLAPAAGGVGGASAASTEGTAIRRPEVRESGGLVFVRVKDPDALRVLFGSHPQRAQVTFSDREEFQRARSRTVTIQYVE